MDSELFIPSRLDEWAKSWPRLAELLDSGYGQLLRRAYEALNVSLLYKSDTHGTDHIERTMLFGAMYAFNEAVGTELAEDILLCCAWHDIGRTNDKYDEEHGRKSSARVKELGLEKYFHNPREALAAIDTHARPDSKMPEIMELYSPLNPEVFRSLAFGLKDADNLDRVRLYDLDTSFLRGSGTASLVPMAEWILREMRRVETVLCYGDSNTYGYNPSTGERYPEFMRWPDKLREYLGKGYRVIPEGMNGRTTVFERKGVPWLNGISTLDSTIHCHFPIDILVFMLGTNDCCAELGLTADEITRGMERLVDEARRYLGEVQEREARIIIIAPKAMDETVLHGTFEGEMDEKSISVSQQLPETYRRLAERKGCGFMDLEDVLRLSEKDGEHFTPFGGQKLARKLADIILNG